VIVALACVTLALAACTGNRPHYASLPSPTESVGAASPAHPNIVFVLTDDLSWNLVRYMPHVVAMQQQGMTFTNYTVTDSLCCPSRASIFSGKFPHDTHVLSNLAPRGGFERFHQLGEEKSTFATSLLAAGYRTGFFGKYLNQYDPGPQTVDDLATGAWVPPGWTSWGAIGDGYPEYNYDMADGHAVSYYGDQPSDYVNTVLQQRATQFVRADPRSSRPFMLEVATFTPHHPYTPAPADVGTFPDVQMPHTPAFDRTPSPAPTWLRGRAPLSAHRLREIQRDFRLRVEDVQSVDRLIGALEQSVRRAGQADNTVFVFSSDNGYHMGQYRLNPGKQTAFDTDIRVPLIVAGPKIPAGTVNTDMVENIDLRPTFEQLAGAPTPADVDGHSVAGLLAGRTEPWRKFALVEHRYDTHNAADPDAQSTSQGQVPPSYTAIRSKDFAYITYASGEHEYYDLTKDPYELHNLGPRLSPARIAQFDQVTNALVTCHGAVACWTAGGGGSTGR
jgi:arylsulfatase A-like enzyme